MVLLLYRIDSGRQQVTSRSVRYAKGLRSCGLQNLREAIAGYRNSIQRQADEKKREAALSFFVEYLERYYFLICFAVYIHSDKSSANRSGQGGFEEWMRARPELYSILRRFHLFFY